MFEELCNVEISVMMYIMCLCLYHWFVSCSYYESKNSLKDFLVRFYLLKGGSLPRATVLVKLSSTVNS